MNFEKKIRELRLKQGLSQVELAKRLNVSPQRICNIERGGSSISVANLKQILNALDCALKIEEK